MAATQYQKSKQRISELISNLRSTNSQLVPTENELMQMVGAGRNTIRKVLGEFEARGELEKIRGKGTFLVDRATEITLSNWSSSELPTPGLFGNWFRRYGEKHSELRVLERRIPYHRYPSEVLNQLVHVDAPDVAQMTPFWLHSFQRLNVFAPIGHLIGERLVKSQHETANELVRSNQGILGVNWSLCPLVLYTNKVVLEKAGLDPDRVPTTLEELAATSERVGEAGAGSFFGSCLPLDRYAYSFLQMYPLLLSFGGGFADPVGNLTIDSEENVRALRWIRGLYSGAGAGAASIRSLDGGRILFASDRLAFLIDGPYGRGHYRHFSGLGRGFDSHYSVSTIPVGPSGRSESVLLSHVLAVSRNSNAPEAAYGLIEYLATDEANARSYFEEFGMIPAMRELLHRPYFFEDPFASVLIRQIETASIGPIKHPLFLRSLPFILQILPRIVFGGADAAANLRYLREIITMIGQDTSATFP